MSVILDHSSKTLALHSSQQINKSISLFIAQNRARNDISNCAEFLRSPKRQRLNDEADPANQLDNVSSCARTNAQPLSRDLQIKYDIAKNEDGPLRRTIKDQVQVAEASGGDGQCPENNTLSQKQPQGVSRTMKAGPDFEEIAPDRYPGMQERLGNIETHFAVRYGMRRGI